MDSKHKLILQRNHEYLKGSLEVHGVLSKLFERCTITLDDRERVEAEVTTEDKVVKLLKILPRKPDKAYEVFLECVDSHIQQRLNSTRIPDDVLEKERQDLDDVIKHFLQTRFEEDDTEKVSFTSLEDTIREELILSGRTYTITADHLQQLVFETFPSSRKKKIQKNSKTSKKVYLMNIARIQVESSEDEQSSTVEDSTESDITDSHDLSLNIPQLEVENMDVKDLCGILKPILVSNDFDLGVFEVFKKEDINGEIFHSLTIDDTRQLFPNYTFGKRKKLLLLRDKIFQDKVKISGNVSTVQSDPKSTVKVLSFRETFRKFDSTARNTDAYKQDAILNTSISRPHNLIEPVHCFIDSQKKNQKNLHKWIAEKTVSFACACMNDRTNGTLHFGVSPRPGDDTLEGEIVGISVDKVKCKEMMHKAIMDSFYEDQIEIIFKCIRPVEFINVISHTAGDKQLVVVEVDIVPDSNLLEDDAVFVKKPKRTLFRFATNTLEPKPLSDDETHEYMKIKKRIADNRRTQENKPKTFEIQEDLRQKFLNMFTGGNDHLSDETYPILFLSPLDSTMDMDFADNFKFVKDIDPCVVFDFDSSSDGKGMYHFIDVNQEQVVKALTTDNFDKNSDENMKNHDTHSHVFEDLRTSSFKPWVFCNGYDLMNKQPMDVLEWKQSRSEGFKEALRFFNDEIPKGRAKVIFLLFSKNYETMLEAAEEVLVKFTEQWVLLAENKEIAGHWMGELLRRKSVDKDNISQRCVLGLPWMHVNQMIQQVMMPTRVTRCEIPCSTGAFVHIKEKVRNELCDLEVIGIKDNDISEIEQEGRMKHRRDVQEDFFRGGQVSWWNFWYGEDVLRRTQHNRISCLVQRGINGKLTGDESKVSIVNLIHQPGAGGTTSARQILWDIRERNRCCVVKQITDQTCDQIVTFRNFEEPTSPLPPVVLLDNKDEENVHNLVLQLENRARIATRRSEERIKAFCVLLLCTRRTKLPLEISHETVVLKQDLDQRELEWFSNKYKTLEESFHKKEGVDPRLLISFNILKENFNPDYIKKTVQHYVEGISNQQEKDLLLYLSMINTYDLDFKSVPVSAFDQLMTTDVGKRNRGISMVSYGLVAPNRGIHRAKNHQWESNISSELQVLLNRSSRAGFGTNLKALAIINPLFSREIFQCLLKEMSLTKSKAMLQFLDSPVFQGSNRSLNELMSIIKDIFKKREELENGKKEKFSPLITEILKEDPDKAADIMIEGFKRTDDPMIAQQISRLYIHCRNWEKALKYAKMSTEMKPKNSYLWDTYGLVYRHMLLEKYDTCAQSGGTVSTEEARDFVKIAVEGLDKFHREQQISEEEKGALTNDAGYFNEVRLVIVLLDLLAFTPFKKEDLHHFLVDDHYSNPSLDVLGNDTKQYLRRLHTLTDTAIRKLEEKHSQLKDSTINNILRSKYGSYQQQMLERLRENVDYYFGEETDVVPKELEPKQKADFRRRRVRRLGGNSLSKILSLRRADNGEAKLQTIYAHVTENITTNHIESSDLKSLIGAVIALNIMTGKTPLPFSVMIENSRKLFEREFDTQSERPSLEPFLFLLLFHWPTENKRDQNLYPIGRIQDVGRKWKSAFNKTHPRQREDGNPYRRRETTYFFLGKGPEYKEIVYYEELHDLGTGTYYKGDEVWGKPKALKKLKRMEGILINEGMDVNVQLETKDGNKCQISIPTAMPIGQRQLWQKRVYFYLGFSWSGPKAFDVSQDQRRHRSDTSISGTMKTQTSKGKCTPPISQGIITPSPQTLSKIEETHAKLRQIKEKKKDGKHLHELEKEEKRLTGYLETLLRQRQEILGT